MATSEEFVPNAPPSLSNNPNSFSPIVDLALAFFTWVGNLLLLIFIPLAFLIPYAIHRGLTFGSPNFAQTFAELAVKDPTAIFLQVLATLPTHLLTFVIVWAVVTRFGRRPFWASLGWGWSKHLGWPQSIALGVLLFFASMGVAYVLGGNKPTQLDLILNSSPASKYLIAFLATFTAPFAEEFVYRGLLYSALERIGGKVIAVIFVLALFTLVHVPQYWPNLGVIAAVGLLSVVLTIVRAVSGKLLPCVVIHFVFNGIQSALIVLGVSSPKPEVTPERITTLIQPLFHFFHFLN